MCQIATARTPLKMDTVFQVLECEVCTEFLFPFLEAIFQINSFFQRYLLTTIEKLVEHLHVHFSFFSPSLLCC